MANDSISLDALRARMEGAEAEFLQAEEAVRKAEEQRERLRTALQVFQEMLAVHETPPQVAAPPAPQEAPPVKAAPRRRSRRKAPKTSTPLVTAPALAIQELEAHGDFLATRELLEILQRVGYKPKGTSTPYDSLYASLWHAANKEGSRVVNRDAKWGLREWLEPGWTPRHKEVGS